MVSLSSKAQVLMNKSANLQHSLWTMSIMQQPSAVWGSESIGGHLRGCDVASARSGRFVHISRGADTCSSFHIVRSRN
jgi:hypothetical protein